MQFWFNTIQHHFAKPCTTRYRKTSTITAKSFAPPSQSVILIDFDGQLVSATCWNTSGDINAAPANLTQAQQDEIVNRVSEDYRPFNVTIK
ncbi:MAG: hypothetical protein C4308_07960 [Chitinophagaceae bacterium]